MAVPRAGRNTDTGAFGTPEAGDFLNIDAHLSAEEIGVMEKVAWSSRPATRDSGPSSACRDLAMSAILKFGSE